MNTLDVIRDAISDEATKNLNFDKNTRQINFENLLISLNVFDFGVIAECENRFDIAVKIKEDEKFFHIPVIF
jgi:hypothetical protein